MKITVLLCLIYKICFPFNDNPYSLLFAYYY